MYRFCDCGSHHSQGALTGFVTRDGWPASIRVAIITMLTASYFSDKSLNRKAFVWPFLLIGAIAFYCSYLVGAENFWLSFSLLIVAGGAMYAPYGPFFAVIPEVLPHNVSGGAMALINSFGALGSFAVVPGLYLNSSTSGFGASSSLCSSLYFSDSHAMAMRPPSSAGPPTGHSPV